MRDLTFTRSGELGVTQVQGHTATGVKFVDRWVQPEIFVQDAGQIIIPTNTVWEILRAADRERLTYKLDLVAAETPGV